LTELSLPQLLQSCQAGDPAAIEQLVGAYRPAVFRLALSILDDAAEADEAAQDTFVAALRALNRYRGDAAFTTWLYAIALNVCRGRLRQRRSRWRLLEQLQSWLRLAPPAAPPPETAVVRDQAQADLGAAVQALPEPQRLVVVLRYYHDLRLTEIAKLLDVTERTVHNRLHAAHVRLRGYLGKRPDMP
jgi:RNA polymerase sigma-70 factor (ECF subfamily)